MLLFSRCRLYSNAYKIIDHVLVSCPYALALWQAFQDLFQVSFPITGLALELFKVVSSMSFLVNFRLFGM